MRIMANFKNPAVVEQCAMRLLPFAEQWRQPGDLVCTNADFSALLQGIGSHALNEESALSLLYFLALTPNDSASQAERCKALLLARLDAVGDDAPDMRSAFQTDHVERLNAGPALFQPAGLRLLREIVPEEEEPEPDGFAPFEPFDEGQADDLPGFPVEALPPVLGNYAQAIATSLQVPADMPAAGLLAAVSLAVQGVYKVNPKPGWLEPLNLYIAVVAKPSERKSPVLAEISRHVYDFCAAENERRAPAVNEYRIQASLLSRQVESMLAQAGKVKKGGNGWKAEDIAAKQAELDSLEPVKPLRLLADDVTPEALTSLLADNSGRMGVFSAEGGLFGILAGLYSGQGGANIDTFLKAYTGDTIQVDRKGRKAETIAHPALTLLLMVQPSVLREIMENETFAGRGLLARFLYSLPTSKVGCRQFSTPAIPGTVAQAFADCLTDLLQTQADSKPADPPKIIRFAPAAAGLAEQFFDELERRLVTDLEDVEGWAGKLHGTTMRIAGVLHCARVGLFADSEPLSGETMRAAISIARYFIAHSCAAFRQMGATEPQAVKDARYIWNRLQSAGKPEIGKRDVLRLCHGRMNARQLDPGLQELERRGYIRIDKIPRGGRPSETVILRPIEAMQNAENQGFSH